MRFISDALGWGPRFRSLGGNEGVRIQFREKLISRTPADRDQRAADRQTQDGLQGTSFGMIWPDVNSHASKVYTFQRATYANDDISTTPMGTPFIDGGVDSPLDGM